jgi:hypothetical protein
MAYAIGLVPALAVAVGQPVWSRVDEAAHYDVIAQYAAGVYPHDSITTIRPETLEIMQRTGVYGFVVDNAYQRPGGFQTMPIGLTDAQHVLWIRRHGWQYSYEAFQPPLYYALALPAWKLGDAISGAFGALYAVRVFDALLAAALAPLAMLIALRLWPAQPSVGWAAAVLTAAMPGVDANLTSITNDVLVSVLGAITLLVACSGRVTLRRALIVGALLGAAILTKTTAVALIPAVVVALAWRGRLRNALAGLAVATVIVLPWIVSNVAIYGEAVTTREQQAMAAFPARTAAFDFWSVSTLHSFVTFWSGDPFLSLPLAVPIALLATFILALAIAGLVRAPRKAPLAIVALAAAGAALASVTSPVLAAFEAPGRLAYVAVAGVVALLAVGLWLELSSSTLRGALVGGFAALALAGLALSLVPSAPEDGTIEPVSATIHSLDTHGSFDAFAARISDCEVDDAQNVWLDVTLQNTGSAPVEWSQTVEVLSDTQTIASSEYTRGTSFPMTLPAGYSQNGWLWLGPQRLLRSADAVRFKDIAAAGYRSIGDLVISTALC